MARIRKKLKRYPTDLTDEEWSVIAPLFPAPSKKGRPRKTDLREVVNAIRYLVHTGCGWEMLPSDFPPWQTVYWWFRRFVRRLLFNTIHDIALMVDRERAGREASPLRSDCGFPIRASTQVLFGPSCQGAACDAAAGRLGLQQETSCDADSTSWVIRYLAQLGALDGISSAAVLSLYATPTGHIRTFASPDRFGSWAREHDEVAPLVGLALLAAGEHDHAARIRAVVLGARLERGWRAFWWQGDAYVCAQSLEFLVVSGGIPDAIAKSERERLAEARVPASAFDVAQRLAAAVHLGAARGAWQLGNSLLDSQSTDGGWPPSSVLLVPNQREPAHFDVQSDDRRLLTTAVSLVALTRWVECDDQYRRGAARCLVPAFGGAD
jgi:transposase